MAVLAYALRTLGRDWRSGEMGVLAAALVVAVAALTAIAFFTDRVAKGVSLQAAEVLAADLRLRSANEPDPALLDEAAGRGLASARTLGFPSVVGAGEASTLAAICLNRCITPVPSFANRLSQPQFLLQDHFIHFAVGQ